MSTDYDNDLLSEGILNFRAKDFDTARRYFERALDVADDTQTRAQANFYLSKLETDPARKRQYLEETLAIDMLHAEARRDLAILDGKLKPEEIVNPDAMPAMPSGTVSVQADRFTCPKCGGRMVFAPDGVSLTCEYCQRSQSLQTGKRAAEEDFFIAMASGKGQRKPVAIQTFSCQGCGATFLLGAQEASAICSYCGSAYVIRQSRELAAPDAILPLAFGQKDAAWRLVHWVEQNKVTPEGQVQAPRALYFPAWTFDIAGEIPWNGRVYQNKRYVPVSGTETVQFDNIPVAGSHKLAGLAGKVLPEYNFSAVRPYDPRYLAGWPAEVYEIAMSDASLDARQFAVERVRNIIASQHGYVQNLGYSASAISVAAFKLVLVPLWVTDYTYQGQNHHVVINGVTGAVHGEHPQRGLLDWLGDLFEGGR